MTAVVAGEITTGEVCDVILRSFAAGALVAWWTGAERFGLAVHGVKWKAVATVVAKTAGDFTGRCRIDGEGSGAVGTHPSSRTVAVARRQNVPVGDTIHAAAAILASVTATLVTVLAVCAAVTVAALAGVSV